MLKNHFLIALRLLRKQKLTSFINIFGLSVGITCASLAFVFLQHELSYDQFHEAHETIYCSYTKMGDDMNFSVTPGPFAGTLKENYPEVVESLRLTQSGMHVKSGNAIYAESAMFVDDNFLSFFDFPLIEGEKKTSLSETNNIVLTQEMATKYFGRKSPIGETLAVLLEEKEMLFNVTGVVENPPSNTSIQFDFLLPLKNGFKSDPEDLDSWRSFGVTSFIRLRAKEDVISLKEKLTLLAEAKYNESKEEETSVYSFALIAFDDYHFNNSMALNSLLNPAEIKYAKTLGIIALLILLISCLNYMNLSNAKSSQRLTEVGVRRMLGADRKQLVSQFLAESTLISLVALCIAIISMEIALPFVTRITNVELTLNWLSPGYFIPLLLIAVVTGFFAGAYPSFLLSKIQAVNTFKSTFKIGGNNLVTKSSMVLQFSLTIGLLICTFVMFQQQQFLKDQNLGFDKEEIVVVSTQLKHKDDDDSQRLIERYKSATLGYEGVKQIASVSHSFNRGNRVQFIAADDGSRDIIFNYRVDPNYIDLLNIELREGRNFSEDRQEDYTKAVIVNEAFIKKYEVEDINTYRLPEKFNSLADAQIIGVTKDYHYTSLKQAVGPMMLHMNDEYHFQDILIKISPDNVSKTLAQLEVGWAAINTDKPFKFTFMDEDIQAQYEMEEKWSNAIGSAAILAILIAFLGLFGFVALVLTERTKEIGIRKILGANMVGIIKLLSKDFLILATIAFVIAVPVTYYYMSGWLENFAFRINMEWWIFAIAGGLSILLVFLTVSIHSVRAALANPVDALRWE